MVVIYSVSCCLGCAGIFSPELAGMACVCIKFVFVILMPLLFIRVYNVRNTINQNIVRLDEFDIINECGDDFSKIDKEMIEDGLMEGNRRMQKIFVLMWILMIWVLTEITGGICLCFCATTAAIFEDCNCDCRPHCADCWSDLKDFVKYYRIFN